MTRLIRLGVQKFLTEITRISWIGLAGVKGRVPPIATPVAMHSRHAIDYGRLKIVPDRWPPTREIVPTPLLAAEIALLRRSVPKLKCEDYKQLSSRFLPQPVIKNAGNPSTWQASREHFWTWWGVEKCSLFKLNKYNITYMQSTSGLDSSPFLRFLIKYLSIYSICGIFVLADATEREITQHERRKWDKNRSTVQIN